MDPGIYLGLDVDSDDDTDVEPDVNFDDEPNLGDDIQEGQISVSDYGPYNFRITTIDLLIEDLMQPTPLNVGARIKVEITHFSNPQEFYVRIFKYIEVMHQLAARLIVIKPSQIRFRSSVIYYSASAKCYIRGEVLSLVYVNGEPICDMNAIDYGYIEGGVSGKQLWTPLYETEVPPLAIKCRLDTSQPMPEPPPGFEIVKNDPKAMCNFLTSYGIILIKNTSTDALTVSFYNRAGHDMSGVLFDYGYLRFGHGLVSSLTYKFKKLENDDEQDVVMLYGDYRKFYVALMPMFTWWLSLQEEFDKYAKLQDALNPAHAKTNLPVGAYQKENSRYERAIITDIISVGKVVKVQFVDSGKTQELELTNIKPMVQSFLQMPKLAVLCTCVSEEPTFKEVPLLEYGSEYNILVKEAATTEDVCNQVILTPSKF